MRRWSLLLLMFLIVPHGANCRPLRTPAPAQGTPAEPDPTTPDEVFAQMKHSFRPDLAKGQHLKFQFNLSDPMSGKYWVTVDDGDCAMGKGTVAKANVTFSCTGADWVRLSNGTLSGFQAFMTGRLHVVGNQYQAHKLDELFP
jgi:putative sterol carrier protein